MGEVGKDIRLGLRRDGVLLGLESGAGALFWGGERCLDWVWLERAGRREAALVAIDMFGAGAGRGLGPGSVSVSGVRVGDGGGGADAGC